MTYRHCLQTQAQAGPPLVAHGAMKTGTLGQFDVGSNILMDRGLYSATFFSAALILLLSVGAALGVGKRTTG